MPKVRHPHLRYEILDELLRKSYNSPMTLEEITDKLNLALEEKALGSEDFEAVKSRTIRQDFQDMREHFKVNIRVVRRHEKPAYYMYESAYRSVHHGGLTPVEADDVRDMLQILQRFLSHEQLQFLHQGEKGTNPIQSLFRMFMAKDLEVGRFLDGGTAILFDSAIQQYLGDRHIEPLSEAIHGRNIVSIKYKPFDRPAKVIDFHPYVLKQYNNRWFCYGYDPEAFEEGRGPYQNLALDRIQDEVTFIPESELKAREKIKPLSGKFRTSPVKDWEVEVFEHIVGVSIDVTTWTPENLLPQPPTVVVAFHPDRIGYETTKPIHNNYKLSENPYPGRPEGWVVCSYKLFPNLEFEQQILMRGDKVKVLSPPDLAQRIREKLHSTLLHYDFVESVAPNDTKDVI